MTTLTTPRPEITRDRWGRPLVIPPAGGKPVAYTRATTYIDVLDDKYNLQQWEKRMVALGLADRPDLLLAVSAHRDDKKALDRITADAKEAAKAHAAATTGTALHALTEILDAGGTLPPLPATATASLDAYAAATADLTAVMVEQFCVLDTLQIGGTPDRVVDYQGRRYIADIKTGSIDFGALKIAMQLAIYARSHTYDIPTGERGIHEASTIRGIVIHLPSVDDPADARCDLHWVDLEAGWQAVQVAKRVREKRRIKHTDVMSPFGPIVKPEPAPDLRDLILACTTPDQVRAVWANHQTEWTDALTMFARGHIETLAT